MLFCISGQSRDACGAAGLGATGLLFAIVVAILNHDGALAVVSLHGPLVGRKDLFGFIQSDDLDVPAHQTESLSEVADMRSEEHTSELQSLRHLVCRLLL